LASLEPNLFAETHLTRIIGEGNVQPGWIIITGLTGHIADVSEYTQPSIVSRQSGIPWDRC
jgi:hypothetical protein